MNRILVATLAASLIAAPAAFAQTADHGHAGATPESGAPAMGAPAGAGTKPDPSKTDNGHSASTSSSTVGGVDPKTAAGGGLKDDPAKTDNAHSSATSTSPK